jgi:hypothetical protein
MDCADGVRLEGEMKLLGVSGLGVVLLLSGGLAFGQSEREIALPVTQYISVPGFPWNKLRAESPGKYESYVDLVAGQWTKVRIQVCRGRTRVYT